MRHCLAVCVLFTATALLPAGETGSRVMSGWFNVTTPDGWGGRRYMDGNEIFAEEFDSNGDNRIDVWRFYRRGMLSSEERDLKGDGKVNYQSRWDPRRRRLLSVFRDTDWRGVNDLEIESTNSRRWEIREDRNRDGVTDRILIVNGNPDLFERLGIDLSSEPNVIDAIPVEYWYELWSDDGYSGTITDYRRFARGAMSHYGEWDEGRVAWRKVAPDYTPPPPSIPVSPAITPAEPPPEGGFYAGGQPDGQYQGGYSVAPEEGTGAFMGEPYTDPATGTYSEPYYQEPSVLGTPPPLRDRTRYEGLPPGESSARSLPARMRPPGVGRR